MASNAERLSDLYAAFWRGHDWHAGAELMAPDIEWNGLGDDATLGGTRYGPRAVNQFFVEWLEAWDIADVDWDVEEVTPDILLVRTRLRTRGRGSGIESEAEIGQVWEFRDTRAVRQTMYRNFGVARDAADRLSGRVGG